MIKEKETKEAFLAGAEWMLKEVDDVLNNSSGGVQRSMEIKLFPVRDLFKAIKKINK